MRIQRRRKRRKNNFMRHYHLFIGNRTYSSWSFRAWLLMKFADLEFSCDLLPLFTAETDKWCLKNSPTGKLPCLKVGQFTLAESLAIAEYIAECYPHKNLWPNDLNKRAIARSICIEICTNFSALHTEMPMNLNRKNKPTTLTPDCQKDIRRIEKILETVQTQFSSTGPFIFGSCSITDAFLIPILCSFKSYLPNKDLLPLTKNYMRFMLTLPEVLGWYQMAANEPFKLNQFDLP